MLPKNFDSLLNTFVYFQDPENGKSNEKSATAAIKENTSHNHYNRLLPIILHDLGTSYGAYFAEPEIMSEKVVSHASAENGSQIYKKRRRRRVCKRFDTKTNSVLSFEC